MTAHAATISAGTLNASMGKAPMKLSTRDVAYAIARGLRKWAGDTRHAAKKIGRLIQADPRTVESWLAAENAPGAAHFVTLIAVSPQVRAEVFALTGIQLPPALDQQQVEAICRAAAILEGRG